MTHFIDSAASVKNKNSWNVSVSAPWLCPHTLRRTLLHSFAETAREWVIEFIERIKWILSSSTPAPHPSLRQVLLVQARWLEMGLTNKTPQISSRSAWKCPRIPSPVRAMWSISCHQAQQEQNDVLLSWNLQLPWKAAHRLLLRAELTQELV